MNNIIDCEKIRQNIILDAKKYKLIKKPFVVIFLIGNNESSLLYVNNKIKLFKKENIKYKLIKMDKIKYNDLANEIKKYNNDKDVTGIFIQLPLPFDLKNKTDELINYISPEKDVDGLTYENIGKHDVNKKSVISCTAFGISKLLEYENIQTKGKNVVVVGKSNLAGKPIAKVFLNKESTVTICDRNTKNIENFIKKADIVISATGQKHLIKKQWINNAQIIIDVGMTKKDKKILGDFEPEAYKIAKKTATSPGGVGLLTVASLFHNILYLCSNKKEND